MGVVCNPASVDGELRHVADRLAADARVRLAALFGPQHGFRSDVQENMIETGHGRDDIRRVPVYSLYSETREPTAEMLRDLDVLVIDLQDVGTRIYTYIYTMANCLRAARRHGVKVVVCDRPNPIGGVAVEGPMLEPGFESFVGLYPIPMRHGMTIGELARLFNEHFGIGADLEVVAMDGWRRGMYSDATGLPWVLPSPNIPTLDSAIVYPGTVLFEGTNVSEGRGTTRPFEIVGAPWIVAERFADAMNRLALPGRASGRRCSSRPSTSTRSKPAAAARSTCSIARRSGRSKPASRSSPRFAPAIPPASGGAIRRTNTSTRSGRSTSSRDRRSCGNRLTRALQPARSRARGRLESTGLRKCGRSSSRGLVAGASP